MVKSIILENISVDEVKAFFENLQKQLDDLKSLIALPVATEYLTRTEVARLLKCDITTVHNWTKKGKLKGYYKGNRVYYKRHEIDTDMVPLNSKNRKNEK